MEELLNKPEFLTLGGIILGWALSAFSSSIKFRNDRKADLAIAVSHLLPELQEIAVLKNALEGFKDTSESWEDYETVRQRLWKRHGQFFQDTSTKSWDEIVDRIARHKPILAIKVRAIIGIARKLHTNNLTAISGSSKSAYLKLLSALEVAHIGLLTELPKLIRRLSWSGSIGLGLSFETFMISRGGGSKIRKKNADFVNQLHLDVWNDISLESKSKAELQD